MHAIMFTMNNVNNLEVLIFFAYMKGISIANLDKEI